MKYKGLLCYSQYNRHRWIKQSMKQQLQNDRRWFFHMRHRPSLGGGCPLVLSLDLGTYKSIWLCNRNGVRWLRRCKVQPDRAWIWRLLVKLELYSVTDGEPGPKWCVLCFGSLWGALLLYSQLAAERRLLHHWDMWIVIRAKSEQWHFFI